MMEVIARLNYLRISPRKVRMVADLIRGKKVEEARKILNFCPRKPAKFLLKLLESAIANARENFKLKEEKLFIKRITVDEGPRYKRIFPRARGRADIILKRTSHINLVLDEK